MARGHRGRLAQTAEAMLEMEPDERTGVVSNQSERVENEPALKNEQNRSP